MDSDPPLSTNMMPERTFQFDEGLPPLPVPQLDDTLDKYLDSGMLTVKLCGPNSRRWYNLVHGLNNGQRPFYRAPTVT